MDAVVVGLRVRCLLRREIVCQQWVELVTAYLGHCDEPDLARVRLHRAAAEYREGMWGVVQQVLSELDFDFAGYAEHHLAAMLESDWEEWLDGAAA